MRKFLVGFFVVATVSGGALAEATYVIKLNNGNEYFTNRYWQHGSQILFDAEGGVFGIDKRFVKNIEKTDKVIRLVTVAERDPVPSSAQDLKRSDSDVTAKETDKATKVPTPHPPTDPVKEDVAKLKEQTKNVAALFPDDIRALMKEAIDYKTKLLKSPKAWIEHGQEFNDLQEMIDALDAALKK